MVTKFTWEVMEREHGRFPAFKDKQLVRAQRNSRATENMKFLTHIGPCYNDATGNRREKSEHEKRNRKLRTIPVD